MCERAYPNNFSLMVGASKDRWRLRFTEISCQMSTWRSGASRKMRHIRQLELTNKGFKESLTEFCTDSCNNIWLDAPSFSCKTFSFRSVFCSHSTSHKEAYLNCTLDNMDFGHVSSHLFETLVEQSMGLCQRFPFRTCLQSGRDFLVHAACRAPS